MSYCFKVDHPKIVESYNNNFNFKVEHDEKGNPRCCVIYFTSHALYFPDDEDAFIERVVKKDIYEWYNTRHLNAGTHVFVRDVRKQWYLSGINSEVNTIDALLCFLSKLTVGKSVICVGASAGGYAAILFGCMLGAESVFAFSPQINLNNELQYSTESENALLHRLKETKVRKYYDLNDYMPCKTDIFYIYPNMSKWDLIHLNLLNISSNIHLIPIRSASHGVPVPKLVLKEFISSKKKSLLKFVEKNNRPIEIMISMNFLKTMHYYIKIYSKILKNKSCR